MVVVRDIRGKSPFEVLGVPNDADGATIRRKWMEETRKHHPDKRHGDTQEEIAEARQRFEDVHAAFKALEAYMDKARKEEAAAAGEEARRQASEQWKQPVLAQLGVELEHALQEYAKAQTAVSEVEAFLRELKEELGYHRSQEATEELNNAHDTAFEARLHCLNRVRHWEAQSRRIKERQDAVACAKPASRPPQRLVPDYDYDSESDTEPIHTVGDAVSYIGNSVAQTLRTTANSFSDIAEDAVSVGMDFAQGVANMVGYFQAWRAVREDRE
mmetsp:Transcript_31247/g.72271  ORF Transcript_31247/g.72271 Transcript_31247/m.72271 type:complete len:272 (-) Transcript_31247:81-896(-)